VSEQLRGAWDWDLVADRATLSPEYLQMLGTGDREVDHPLGWIRNLIHPDDWPAIETGLHALMSGAPEPYVVCYRVRQPTGEHRWLRAESRALTRDENGAPLRLAGVVTDESVTTDASSRPVWSAHPDLLFRMDRELRYLAFESGDPSKLAVPPEAFLGRTITEVFGGDRARAAGFSDNFCADVTAAVERAFATRQLQTVDYTLRDRMFETRIVCSAPDEVMAISRDVTELRQTQRALEEAVRSRDLLLAVVSHDLRGPLSAVQLSAASLYRNLDATAERRTKQLETIMRSTERMKTLIENLLQASTIDAGAFTAARAREAVRPLIDEALQSPVLLARSKSVRVECQISEDLGEAFFDRQRILQVLANLLGNAERFVQVGGRIAVRAWREAGNVCFAVSDDGPGIEAEHLPHIFKRFWKSGGTGPLGTGLGLFIAKAIVDAHGGRIWVDSKPGQGTTFYFTFPGG
jgi:signal transduction histidine kinase